MLYTLLADVDECKHMSSLCENGECVNNDGSYRCKCKMGFKLDASRKKCVGKFNKFYSRKVMLAK